MSEIKHSFLETRIDQEILVITITESHLQTDAMVDDLRQDVVNLVNEVGAKKIVVDLQKVEYISSAGFRPLLALRRKMNEVGGRMVLCGLTPDVTNIFRITRMISSSGSSAAPFDVQPDLAAAMARLNPAAPTP